MQFFYNYYVVSYDLLNIILCLVLFVLPAHLLEVPTPSRVLDIKSFILIIMTEKQF